MSLKYLTVFLMVVLIVSASGCGIWWPIRSETQPREMALVDRVRECSGIDFRDLRSCFPAYKVRIEGYLKTHPERNHDIAEKMRNAVVAIGMSEEQDLVMFEPDEIINDPISNTKILKFNDMGTWGNPPEEGGREEVVIKNGAVVKINCFKSFYGL